MEGLEFWYRTFGSFLEHPCFIVCRGTWGIVVIARTIAWRIQIGEFLFPRPADGNLQFLHRQQGPGGPFVPLSDTLEEFCGGLRLALPLTANGNLVARL